ncbi:hypothetical protein XHV734_4253 [Xanthomonas hortorum pv. vitians]|nr:hypothetical protein XHV734_4253 [Xanthomonas hortorum pv. vitians]
MRRFRSAVALRTWRYLLHLLHLKQERPGHGWHGAQLGDGRLADHNGRRTGGTDNLSTELHYCVPLRHWPGPPYFQAAECYPGVRPYAGRGGGSRPERLLLPFPVSISDRGSTGRHARVKRP